MMTSVTRFWPLLCGTHRYDKSLSTRGMGEGVIIEAPILAYLIETRNGRILYDVGCDYNKVHDPKLRAQWYENPAFAFGPPEVTEEQRLPSRLAQLGLDVRDVDCVVCGHLHFDHAGGLNDMAHAEVHVHQRELVAMCEPADEAYFQDDFTHGVRWCVHCNDYGLGSGVQAIETPGHTAGHMSMLIELPKGKPVLLCGDAADLQENLDEEIAPGLCWHDSEQLAVSSIRKLKQIAEASGAELWPNHDMAFFNRHNTFPFGIE
jgi:N-acyl homoserine lactone hydrolase